MRSTLRLLAEVKPARFLQPYAPTGLTGLVTHPQPRQALLVTYTKTLERLKQIPESSVYRQATEALTQHRLKIVESIKPPGYDQWLQEVEQKVAANPDLVQKITTPDGSLAAAYAILTGRVSELEKRHYRDNMEQAMKQIKEQKEQFEKLPEEEKAAVARWSQQQEREIKEEQAELDVEPERKLEIYEEPALESAQISEIEHKIGAGLIEEIVQVAEGELKLVNEMVKSKVWEELEEKPKPGQWTYFGRAAGEG
ncbi:hypothetical protein AJ79_09325 [Helicocarpus griseus UAMH5409]|uniref:Uncharacterized protein n=1 Tax=Helicocarpus griseus UAMH5409 TaxID=1447875 RepID=A0A2B7WKI1_9EURO|nr:hypothetical protein AJ79_09325 [Helicocarpus griseus UAMH5409]